MVAQHQPEVVNFAMQARAVDLAVTHQVLGGLPAADVTAIVSTFETDVVRLLQQMDHAWHRGDAATLRFAAHSLAGVSATFGAKYLSTMARRVMQVADFCNCELLTAVNAEASLSTAQIKQAFSAHPV
jgi:HPt (histidine-containing phosphotransfer) domain-containing protein